LTLSSLFPDSSRPVFGPFVERQTREIASHPDVDLRVVAPIGLPPWPLSRHRRYRGFRQVPAMEQWQGLTVYRPRFLHFPGTAGRFDAAAMARAVLPLLTTIRTEFAFDMIDAEFFFPDGPAAVALGKACGVPVSIKARGGDIQFWGRAPITAPQVLAAGQQAAGMLAVSSALKRDMAALGMPEERITVHYTGVDLDCFQPVDRIEAKRQRGLQGPLISCVGGLIARKGQRLLIEILPLLPDANLVLIGNGEDREILEKSAVALGVNDRVIFTGAIAQSEIAQWLAASDVMALPSRSEGLANAWVEALACGTPIVICDVGGARELLTAEHPLAGQIVDRDAAKIAAAIRHLLDNPPSPHAVRKAATGFTWARNRDALFAHFSSLIGK